MAGMRLDRAVSMAANVSRSTAAELVERGPGAGRRRTGAARQGAAQRGRRAHRPRAPARRHRRGARSRASSSRSSTPTPRSPSSTSRRGSSSIPGPVTPRAPWSVASCRAFPTWRCSWPRACARRTVPASCTGSTRAPRGSSPWPARPRPTAPSSSSSPPAPWSAATWPWSRARWPTTGVRSRRPSAARPEPRPRWPSPRPASPPAPPTPCGSAGRLRPLRVPRPCSSWPSRADARTRYASTWPPSAIPWWATPATEPRTSASARAASSCTHTCWP